MVELKILPMAHCLKCGLPGTEHNPVRLYEDGNRRHAICDVCAKQEAERNG